MKINVYMDDARTPCQALYIPDPYWVVVRTVQDTKVLLSAGIVENMSLDHDMGSQDTGHDLLKWMEENDIWPSGNISVHTMNPVGRANMLAVLKKHYES